MKVKILLILLPLLLLVACDKKKIAQLTNDLDSLKAQNAQLVQENSSIKMYVEEVSKVIESVDQDLDKIVETEIDIREMKEGAKPGTLQSEIKDKLGRIGQYIVDSKAKISDLEAKLLAGNQEIKGLKTMVANLKAKLETKENEIAALMKEVGVLESDIEKLGIEIKTRDEQIANQESIIEEHKKRYYVYGTEDELKDKGIIVKEGGFLGFGKTIKIAPGFDIQYFNIVDGEEVFEVSMPVGIDKVKIISPHDAISYQISGDENLALLKVLDPDQFWEATKCLVIVTK
ncbi:MAG TPA: hypothetical protein VGD14_13295 [bacterium]